MPSLPALLGQTPASKIARLHPTGRARSGEPSRARAGKFLMEPCGSLVRLVLARPLAIMLAGAVSASGIGEDFSCVRMLQNICVGARNERI